MATLADILKFRGPLERGFAAGLFAAARLAPFTRQNAVVFQKDTPRFEITVAIGSATGARRAFAVEQITRYTRRHFNVSFKVVTRPASALVRNEGESDEAFQARVAANNTLHEDMVAIVREYASSAAQESWADTDHFPFHYIAEPLRDLGSPSVLKPEGGNEETTLTFAGQVGVRESAWLEFEAEVPSVTPEPAASGSLATEDNFIIETEDVQTLVTENQ